MNYDYSTSRRIAQTFYEECYKHWYFYGMNMFQAHRKAEQEVLALTVNPFTGEGNLDVMACRDFVAELKGGVSA